eukprot:scaffold7388_cov101-Amphora_coffeaeformis.AAC.1
MKEYFARNLYSSSMRGNFTAKETRIPSTESVIILIREFVRKERRMRRRVTARQILDLLLNKHIMEVPKDEETNAYEPKAFASAYRSVRRWLCRHDYRQGRRSDPFPSMNSCTRFIWMNHTYTSTSTRATTPCTTPATTKMCNMANGLQKVIATASLQQYKVLILVYSNTMMPRKIKMLVYWINSNCKSYHKSIVVALSTDPFGLSVHNRRSSTKETITKFSTPRTFYNGGVINYFLISLSLVSLSWIMQNTTRHTRMTTQIRSRAKQPLWLSARQKEFQWI